MSTTPYEYVDREFDHLVDELRDCCRIASVSATASPGLLEMSEWLRQRLAAELDAVEQIPVPGYAPAVVGELQGEGDSRLLLYSHYDVQPADPESAWASPPFAAEMRDGRIYARGACDDKADVMARIHALRAWRHTRGPLPFTVVWLSEGAEEIGSPGLAELIAQQHDRLRADGCLWESYLRRDDGTPEIAFGCRGLLYVELSLRLLAADQHSAFATVFRSAPARMVRALGTLFDEDGRVAVDNVHELVAVPSDLETAALEHLPVPEAGAAALADRSPFLVPDGRELVRRLVYEPSLNIAGIWSGYTGSGAKTVLPAEARAKLDFRLVPDQRPETVLSLLRAHLDRRGFSDIEIDVLSSVAPARSPMDTPLGDAVVQAARETIAEPTRYPIIPGSGPMHLVVDGLGVPTIAPPGSTRMGSGMHAPDEHIRLSDYRDQLRLTIRVLELLAQRGGLGPAPPGH